MSFLTIKDPKKREEIVKEYDARKKRILERSYAERLGEFNLQTDLTKMFTPITQSQTNAATNLLKELGEIKDNSLATSTALQALPASISSQLNAIQGLQRPQAIEGVTPGQLIHLGDIANTYL